MAIRARQYGLAYHRGEPWHYVGAVGEPAFENGWGNVFGLPKMAFRRREVGIVDIQGTVSVSGGSVDPIFTLPVGFRPSATAVVPALGNVASCGVSVSALGTVQFAGFSPVAPQTISVNGIVFLTSPDVALSGTGYGGDVSTFFSYRTVTADDTIEESDAVIGASNTITLTLLSVAAVVDGHTVTVKNEGTGVVTIDGYSTQTIDGDLTFALAPGESVTLVSTGANWIIV